MSEASPTLLNLPLGQQGILDKSFHPSGTFVEFPIEETEQSIPQRFENIVALYPSCPAVKANGQCLTYDELNRFANRIAHALFEAPTVAGFTAVIAQSRERDAVQVELARLVIEVENLSEEEAQQILSQMQSETIQ